MLFFRLNPKMKLLPKGWCPQYRTLPGNIPLGIFIICPRRHDCVLCRGQERFEEQLTK